jgi:hypothetical protein
VTTAELLEDRARELAEGNAAVDEGARELLECCASKRVSVVVARHHFLEEVERNPEDGVALKAVALLDAALARGDWTLEEAL